MQKPPPQPFAAQSDGKASEGEVVFQNILRWLKSNQDVSVSASASATAALSPSALETERARINDLFMETTGRAQEAGRVTEGALLIPSLRTLSLPLPYPSPSPAL